MKEKKEWRKLRQTSACPTSVLHRLPEEYIDVEMFICESTSDNTELDLSTGPQGKLQNFMFHTANYLGLNVMWCVTSCYCLDLCWR